MLLGIRLLGLCMVVLIEQLFGPDASISLDLLEVKFFSIHPQLSVSSDDSRKLTGQKIHKKMLKGDYLGENPILVQL